ncbi:MAG TPA: maleylpyruvate isomerase family mycothiol-dependent enzyme [Streptosporangiaceae bacterium]
MTIFDDLSSEQERLAQILSGLTDAQWLSESGAAGWTVADVVLHLAQSEEGVVTSATGGTGLSRGDVDDWAAAMVTAERAEPAVVFERWQRARVAAVAALRSASPEQQLQWVGSPLKPATLATTRLAEHWAHGLDITGPLGIDFPDTDRLRHIAWLAVRTLPYALARSGVTAAGPVRVSLTSPSGEEVWTFGPDNAESVISGPAGAFCRVAAQRLAPGASGLAVTGPSAAAVLGVIRTYA